MAEGGNFRENKPNCASKRDVFYENVRKELSTKDIKDILLRMLSALQTNEEYCHRLNEAKLEAGSNMAELMYKTYPIVAEAQIKILEDLKVGTGTKGLVEFSYQANILSRENEDINHLFSEIRKIFLPPLKNKHLIKPENYQEPDEWDPKQFRKF